MQSGARRKLLPSRVFVLCALRKPSHFVFLLTLQRDTRQDFRSKEGLYNVIQQRYPNLHLRGHELFDNAALHDPNTLEAFFTFIGELRLRVGQAMPTRAHFFFRKLADKKKLMRYYTQNIDYLEDVIGLKSVRVHGTLNELSCHQCACIVSHSIEYARTFVSGRPPECPNCAEKGIHLL
jgi:NAD-dependent histone deacetylase SIR2